jgi:hypothetical protein
MEDPVSAVVLREVQDPLLESPTQGEQTASGDRMNAQRMITHGRQLSNPRVAGSIPAAPTILFFHPLDSASNRHTHITHKTSEMPMGSGEIAARVPLADGASIFPAYDIPLETGPRAKRTYRKDCERRVASPTTCVNGDSPRLTAECGTRVKSVQVIPERETQDAEKSGDWGKPEHSDQADKARRRSLGVDSGSNRNACGTSGTRGQETTPVGGAVSAGSVAA